MKEFMIKHPWMTFFGVLAVVDGLVSIAKIVAVTSMTNTCAVVAIGNEEEENNDEPAGDIQ